MELFFFYIFAGLTVLSAVLVISFRNALSSAFSLVLCLFGVASLFALLGAHFLAAMQVLVYAGAVMVLFVFIIMLLDLGKGELLKIKLGFSAVLGILFGPYLGVLLVLRLGYLSFPLPAAPERFGEVREVGRLLFTDYLVPFEIASILLLVAVVGAVVLAKKERTSPL
ncbi:MAG: NADH-quinone oxidoreductase subunit J [Deltaproteobacteria bacterium]|nr:NADH-quinone oxidoreductase subunit J [Deltaproteobacteria bacterium]